MRTERARERGPDPGRIAGGEATCPEEPETYRLSEGNEVIERAVVLRAGGSARTRIRVGQAKLLDSFEESLADHFDREFLGAAIRPKVKPNSPDIRLVDLFSGCGAMSLGIWEAARAVGARVAPIMALDSNRAALRVYEANFPGVWPVSEAVESILDGALGAPASSSERHLVRRLGRVDMLVGGPPCQGHSNLNNYTRRSDPKNVLYDRMARFAELVRPKHVIIENVPAVLHDKGKVVDRTVAHLRHLNYHIDNAVVEALAVGVPQRRRRHFVVASRDHQPDICGTVAAFARRERSVTWAIGDLARVKRTRVFDQPSAPSRVNSERIEYLFNEKLFELPDDRRPDCHRLAKHSYTSVYGRLRPDRPAQTITSGFLSMGQGRYVHPTQRRTITPHEAARLQFIPDFFDFEGVPNRTALAEMIGNAVPPKLAYILGVDLLR